MKSVCVVPGDGIGPEVVGCAVKVLKEVVDVELCHAQIGLEAFGKTGASLPDETLDLMRTCDTTLLGAVTSSDEKGYGSPVIRFRKELELYANLRPVRTLCPFPGRPLIDTIIVRENTEGMYTQDERQDADGVVTHRRVTRKACERIVDFAVRHALAAGRREVCCVHKSNVLKASDGLFVQVFRERMAALGGGLVAREQLVDSAAMKLVTSPSSFDVIVTLNLYGDILSDVAAGVAGGLGFAPSGNIGERHSVFEPAHGSAPDIAGKGVANPSAAILSAAMALSHVGQVREAESVMRAVEETYRAGHLTVDLGGTEGSAEFTDSVIRTLRGRDGL